MVADGFAPRSSNTMAPYWDVISLDDFVSLACIRPNNAPRADAPECKYFLNRFILENTIVLEEGQVGTSWQVEI